MDNVAITADATANFSTITKLDLLVAQETVDEEIEATGATPAQCTIGSKLIGIKFRGLLVAGTTSDVFKWMLFKDPDGDLSAIMTSFAANQFFHSANDTATNRELRKGILAKGMFVASSSSNSGTFSTFVRKKAIARNSIFKEGDTLRLFLAHNKNNAGVLNAFGTMYIAQT